MDFFILFLISYFVIFFLLTWRIHFYILGQFVRTCRYFTTDITRPSHEILETGWKTGEGLNNCTDLGKCSSLCCRKFIKACMDPSYYSPSRPVDKKPSLPLTFSGTFFWEQRQISVEATLKVHRKWLKLYELKIPGR